MRTYGAQGLALTLVVAALVQSVLLITVLHRYFNFTIYARSFARFLKHYCAQLLVVCGGMALFMCDNFTHTVLCSSFVAEPYSFAYDWLLGMGWASLLAHGLSIV